MAMVMGPSAPLGWHCVKSSLAYMYGIPHPPGCIFCEQDIPKVGEGMPEKPPSNIMQKILVFR